MTRIPILEEGDLNQAQQRVLDEIKESRNGTVLDLFKVLLHSPVVADHAQRLGAFHRHHSSLSTRLVEISVLTTAQYWSCAYAWYHHDRYARACGIEDDIIEAILEGREPALTAPDDILVYRFTRELLVNRHVGDETYQAAWQELGATGVVELTALIGYYTMITMTLNTHQVPLPDGASPELPPPG
tara:strand:+ start:6847 stop:7404 length:558 start_codon:yes stop_codon:yes gene_type:complete